MMEVDWLPHCSLHVFSCNRRAQLSAPRMKSKRRWVGSRQLPALPCPAWLHFHPAGVRHPACARNCWLVQEGVNAALDLAGTVSCPLHTLWLPAPSPLCPHRDPVPACVTWEWGDLLQTPASPSPQGALWSLHLKTTAPPGLCCYSAFLWAGRSCLLTSLVPSGRCLTGQPVPSAGHCPGLPVTLQQTEAPVWQYGV